MEITVKHNGSEITIKETSEFKDRHATMKWKDENKQIQETLIVMVSQVNKLQESLIERK